MSAKPSAGTGTTTPSPRKASSSSANIWVHLTRLIPLGVSENVLPKIFKAPPKKAGEEEGDKDERRGGYGTVS